VPKLVDRKSIPADEYSAVPAVVLIWYYREENSRKVLAGGREGGWEGPAIVSRGRDELTFWRIYPHLLLEWFKCGILRLSKSLPLGVQPSLDVTRHQTLLMRLQGVQEKNTVKMNTEKVRRVERLR
jgi:hypothetical protein